MKFIICLIFLITLIFIGCNKTDINAPADNIKLNLVFPAGGEKLLISGNPITIKWTSENIEIINIYYSSINDSVWELIADSVNASKGSFDWDIQNMKPDSYKLKITDSKNEYIFDLNDSPFSINTMLLDLTYPNGGEEFIITSTPVKIKWISDGIEKVKLYYSAVNDSTWNLIADSINGPFGSFDWNIINIIPGMYKIKISDYQNENLIDTTDDPFSIIYDPNIINASIYYPLEVGDRWVYSVRYQQSIFPPPIDTIYSLERKIISDTCFEDGKVYFKILETDYYRQYTKIYFERFDSTNGNIYRRYTDDQFGEVLVDSLLAKVGDQFIGHRFTLPNSTYYMYTEFLQSILTGYFGVVRTANKYREIDTYAVYDYFLVENIGLGNYYEGLDLSSLDVTLKGCIINNVLYGDTTISY